MKKQPTEWEKILVSHIADEGLPSRTYEGHLQLDLKQGQITQFKMDGGSECNTSPRKVYKQHSGREVTLAITSWVKASRSRQDSSDQAETPRCWQGRTKPSGTGVGGEMGAATVEDAPAGPQNVEHTATVGPSNPTLACVPTRTDGLRPHGPAGRQPPMCPVGLL